MTVEEQVQWILSYVQRESANIQKENIMEDLKSKNLSYITVGEFLSDLKEEFRGGDKKMLKVTELKKVKQESRITEEFVQEFKKVARESGYKEILLIEEFEGGMNRIIQ